jgi:arylsulfatase A-like enzyme
MKKKRNFLSGSIFLCFAILLFSFSFSQKAKEKSPNVIYIFPDQFRNYSLGFWSQPGNEKYLQGAPDPVSTPALDKLASEAIVFNRATSNYPLCSPYRGMLLSGMYPDSNGLTGNCRDDKEVELRTDLDCITDIFARQGYDVSYFGKCHWVKTEPLFDENGTYHGTAQAPGGKYINRYDTYVPPGPHRHGIKYFYQTLKDDHHNPLVYSSDPIANEGKKDGEQGKVHRFSSEVESEKVIDYLKNTHEQRDPNKPFFMIWSLNPPHNPWNDESTYPKFVPLYSEKSLSELLTHSNADTISGNHAKNYFANVSAVDYFIGQVLKELDKLGLTENTIIVFSSDHGEMLGSHGKQGKNVPEIESLNIPFIIKWGNKFQHRVENLILSVPDIMPTLLTLAGFGDEIPATVQGKNYSSVLLNRDSKEIERPKSALFIGPKSRGVYTGHQTFVVEEGWNGEMAETFCYNNDNDPYQINKIPFEALQNGQELKAELARLLKETNDLWYTDKVCTDFLDY